ncbi:MAG: energy-coupling factor transporter ATPase [Clostridia bacterium]|nr:energy-coupling factor transporter ATPase [Oscillospiraceae bacterium]MBQ7033924.1 energy-coupling factor transporter ATPase [Clostridia bacterium]
MGENGMICLENASYFYPESGQPALHDVSLTIEKGEFVAVLGHNGSGKSTLAKLLNGVLVPTAGKVTVDGLDTADENNTLEIRRRVGMVFQNPDNQIVATVVEEDVAFGPENLGLEPEEIRFRVDAALHSVDMYAYRMHAPHLLSGGQKQRVAIAGIIAMRPACIVLDEPTAMLDPSGRAEVMETILRLCRSEGITVVLITHFMQEAALADRVIVTGGGHVLMDGSPREILTRRDELRAARLDTPQTTELLYRLHRAGIPVEADSIDIESCIASISAAYRKEKKQ